MNGSLTNHCLAHDILILEFPKCKGSYKRLTMSFRKRNVGLSGPSDRSPVLRDSDPPPRKVLPKFGLGVRPSPLDGRPTTSTGTQSLDNVLGGYAGLALGNSLLIEENGTTDFAGVLLRYFAAEGIAQGHNVHVVGVGERWGRELPGIIDTVGIDDQRGPDIAVDKEKMKIAWRYERLGEFGAGARGGITPTLSSLFSVHKQHLFIKTIFCFFIHLTNEYSSSYS